MPAHRIATHTCPHTNRYTHARTHNSYTHMPAHKIATHTGTCSLAPSLMLIPLPEHKPGFAPQPSPSSPTHFHTTLFTTTLRCLSAPKARSAHLVGLNYFLNTPTAYSSIHCFTSSNMVPASDIVDPASLLSAQTLPPPPPTPQPYHLTSPESNLISASCRYLLRPQPHTSSAPP
jgi:hypothetical protein